jgi:hypothetical protein
MIISDGKVKEELFGHTKLDDLVFRFIFFKNDTYS